MIIVLRYRIYQVPTVIYELYGRSRITTGLLYSIFGLRVPDGGTVTFDREIKLKMGFSVVHCCCYYDKIYLQLIDMGDLRFQGAIYCFSGVSEWRLMINVNVKHNERRASPRHYTVDPMLFPSGNPFKCHEEVLYLQPLIPPKRFDMSPPLTGRCSGGLCAF